MKMNDSKGFQTFNVPNTPEGQAFIKLARKFSNKSRKIQLRVRGRGPRPSRRFQSYIPNGISKWLAVYIKSNNDEVNCRQDRQEQNLEMRNMNLQLDNQSLKAEVDCLKEHIGRLLMGRETPATPATPATPPARASSGEAPSVNLKAVKGQEIVIRIEIDA